MKKLVLVLFILLSGCTNMQAVEMPPEKETAKNTSMLFTGDIMLGRFVETLMERHSDDYPFMGFDLNSADLTVINLEGPIPTKHIKTPDFTTNFSFKESVAPLIKKHGVDLVTLANNHTFDKGAENFANTRTVLENAGLKVFGHPRELNEQSYTVVELNNQDFLFVGFNEAVSSFFNEADAINFVQQLDEKFPDHIMIINIHWGIEYVTTSSEMQQKLAHAFVDNGADLIIGHHPHVVQESEIYNNKYIYYSLGNYIFDQYFSEETQTGLVIKAIFDKEKNVKIEEIPIKINRSQPQSVK